MGSNFRQSSKPAQLALAEQYLKAIGTETSELFIELLPDKTIPGLVGELERLREELLARIAAPPTPAAAQALLPIVATIFTLTTLLMARVKFAGPARKASEN